MATNRALLAAAAAAAAALLGADAHAQPKKITIGVYAPSVEFGSSTARLAYTQALGKAIEQRAGVQVEARSYANITALQRDKVDFAIVDAPCVATHPGWKVLANAVVGGSTQRPWALYSSAGPNMRSLSGKKLAYMTTGCNDAGFVDNAMLESEVDAGFFGARVGKPDLTAAIAEVVAVKAAQAVFAPVGSVKGLTKVFDTGTVPNPAFVEINDKLPNALSSKVAAAIVAYGGSGAISGWSRPAREPYNALAASMRRVVKSPLLANPEPVRFEAKDVLVEPQTMKKPALVGVRHHFVRAPGTRLE